MILNYLTTENFAIPRDGSVKLSIYDVSGKLVSTLADGFKTAGTYSVTFNASNFSSGVYYYKVEFNNGSESVSKVMKMLMIK